MEERDKLQIENCARLFKFLCPKKWENLQPTEQEDVRFCTSCRKDVTLCTTLEAVRTHSGHCIALVVPKGGSMPNGDEMITIAGGVSDPHFEYIPMQHVRELVAIFPEDEFEFEEMEAKQEED